MIKFERNKNNVDIDLYYERIKANSNLEETKKLANGADYDGIILLDRTTLEDCLDKATSEYEFLRQECLDLMAYKSGYACRDLSRDALYYYLTEYERCPEHYLACRSNKSGISISAENVMKPLYENGYAQQFLELYLIYVRKKKVIEKLRKLLQINYKSGIFQGEKELNWYAYHVTQQVNARFYYNSIDIISEIPIEVAHSIGVGDGYFLAWGDFAQADLRIAYNFFLKDAENLKVMNQCYDKYEGIARLLAASSGEEFDVEKFKEERKVYKQHTLGCIYGKALTKIDEVREFINKMNSFLMNSERYQEYKNRIKRYIELDIPIITESYFGLKQAPPFFKKGESEKINFALNSPIQAGTSEMVILTVNSLLDKFYSLGYTEDDISVYVVRHDEPIFRCSERILKDAWIFEEFRDIYVDDWTPLRLDFEFGRNYKVVDEELTEQIKRVVQASTDKITTPSGEVSVTNNFFPLKKISEWQYYEIPLGDKTITAYLNCDLKSIDFKLINSVDEAVVHNTATKDFYDLLAKLHPHGYHKAVVRSNFIDGNVFENDELIIFKKYESYAPLYQVQVMCERMAHNFAEKNGIDYDYREKVLEDLDYKPLDIRISEIHGR